MLWICSSNQCLYEEEATCVARYCAWCGNDLLPVCSVCKQSISLVCGHNTTCTFAIQMEHCNWHIPCTNQSKNRQLSEQTDVLA